VGEDFGVFLGSLDDALDLVPFIGVVDGGAFNDGILAVAVAVDGQ
jgi:hypothetical protein